MHTDLLVYIQFKSSLRNVRYTDEQAYKQIEKLIYIHLNQKYNTTQHNRNT